MADRLSQRASLRQGQQADRLSRRVQARAIQGVPAPQGPTEDFNARIAGAIEGAVAGQAAGTPVPQGPTQDFSPRLPYVGPIKDIMTPVVELPRNLEIGFLQVGENILQSAEQRGLGSTSPIVQLRKRLYPSFLKKLTPWFDLLEAASPAVQRLAGQMAGNVTATRERAQKKLSPATLRSAPLTRLTRSIQQNIPQYGAMVGASLLGGDPVFGIMMGTELTRSQAFAEQLEADPDNRKKADLVGNISGLAEAAGEMLVLPKILKGITGGKPIPLREALNLVIENATQEGATGFAQTFTQVLGAETSKGMPLWRATKLALAEATLAVPENAWVGGAMAFGATGPKSIQQTLRNRKRTRAIDKLTQPMDLNTSLGVPTFPSLTEGGTTPTTQAFKPRVTIEGDIGREATLAPPTENVGTPEQAPTDRTVPMEQIATGPGASSEASPGRLPFTNATIDQRRQALGLPIVPESSPAGTWAAQLQAAKDAGLADIDTAREVAADIINTGRMATDLETHGMHVAWDTLQDRLVALDEELASVPYDSEAFRRAEGDIDTIKEQVDLIGIAGRNTGTMWGKIGGARTVLLGDSGSYAGVIARAKRRAKRDLTPAEETKFRKRVSDYRKKRDKASATATEEAKRRLRQYVQKTTKKRVTLRNRGPLARLATMTTAEKDAQLQDLLSRELTDVTLTDTFLNIASRDAGASIDTTVEKVRALLPNISHTQIVDAFDKLAQRKVRNTSGVEYSLRWLKRQMRKEKSKLTTIDDLLYWIREGRLPDEAGPPTELDDRVVRYLEEVVQQTQKLQRNSEPYIQRKLERHIAFLRGRLDAKDWGSKKEAMAFEPSKYTLQLEWEAAGLRAEISKEIARMHPRGLIDRGLSGFGRTSQALKSSYDNSGLLNQGGFVAWAHPIKAARTLPKALSAALSPRRAYEIERKIRNRPNAMYYQRYGLELTQSTDRSMFTDREEEFRPSLADRVPGVLASNRMFATTLNILRADAFDAMAGRDLNVAGITDVEGRAVADFVNMMTGRSTIRGGKAKETLNVLNGYLWAPRRMISNFQQVFTAGGLLEWGVKPGQSQWRPEIHLRGSKAIRRAMIAEIARSIAGRSVATALAWMAGADLEYDPLSSDFLKWKFGELRIDPMSGLAQTLTLLSRLPGKKKDIHTGRIEELSGYDKDMMLQRFIRYKLSPAIGIVYSQWTGQTPFDGEIEGWDRLTWGLKEYAMPLSLGDVIQAAEDQGIPKSIIFDVWGFLGAGVQVYGDTPQSSGSQRTYRRGAL